jgi:peptidyl-tRNA hydrolase, PTH1 family
VARHLVVGLGNPGLRYRATRHNTGAVLVERLAARWHIGLESRNALAVWGEGRVADAAVVLATPTTFMNASGDAVRALQCDLAPDTITVAFDDLDLPLGRVRVRGGGGSGGHRGVASVIAAIGPAFGRMRIGIGRPPVGLETVDFVLDVFAPAEHAELQRAFGRAEEGVERLVQEGLDAAMRLCNGASTLAIEHPFR